MSDEALSGPLAEYARLTASTLAAWRKHPETGDPVGLPPGRGALGITVGCWLPREDAVLAVHNRLAPLAATDMQMELVPRASLHYTFLALHWDLYDGWPAVPDELRQILPILDKHVNGLNFVVRDLRLVPLTNALLLAGMPDAACAAARQALVAELLTSPWRRFLEDRYAGYPLPPQVWHTTLARYRAGFASQAMRDVYFQNAALRIPKLSMGQPRLVLASETWSRCIEREG
jgi:hypothetical protein